jgi:2',3'-cyclic-nucleotide 2'-phosphodiesterase (5'-nucleotidase family)
LLLTILHTNDFHSKLSADQIRRLKVLRRGIGENGILLDAGDAVAAGNVTFRPAGEPILDAMSEIGYDAMTVGNREFHFSRAGFRAKLSRARFPVLCSNIRPHPSSNSISDFESSTQPALNTVPGFATSTIPVIPFIHRVMPNGCRIVVFGVTVPMITERMLSRKISAYVFDDPIAKAATLAPRLRELYNPDLLIALTHIGIGKDRELAAAVPMIDLIIGGHTHVTLEHGEHVGKTLIVQAGSHGRYYGRVEIVDTDRSPRPATMHAHLEPL